MGAARALLTAGMRVAIVGRDAARLNEATDELERSLGRRPWPICAELGTAGAARDLIGQALERFGRIDSIVAAAGDVPVGSLGSLDEAAASRDPRPSSARS